MGAGPCHSQSGHQAVFSNTAFVQSASVGFDSAGVQPRRRDRLLGALPALLQLRPLCKTRSENI